MTTTRTDDNGHDGDEVVDAFDLDDERFGAQDADLDCEVVAVYGGELWCDTHDSASPCGGAA